MSTKNLDLGSCQVVAHALQVLQVHGGLSEVLYTAFNGKDQVLGLMQDVNEACRRKALQASLVALEAARHELNAPSN